MIILQILSLIDSVFGFCDNLCGSARNGSLGLLVTNVYEFMRLEIYFLEPSQAQEKETSHYTALPTPSVHFLRYFSYTTLPTAQCGPDTGGPQRMGTASEH